MGVSMRTSSTKNERSDATIHGQAESNAAEEGRLQRAINSERRRSAAEAAERRRSRRRNAEQSWSAQSFAARPSRLRGASHARHPTIAHRRCDAERAYRLRRSSQAEIASRSSVTTPLSRRSAQGNSGAYASRERMSNMPVGWDGNRAGAERARATVSRQKPSCRDSATTESVPATRKSSANNAKRAATPRRCPTTIFLRGFA